MMLENVKEAKLCKILISKKPRRPELDERVKLQNFLGKSRPSLFKAIPPQFTSFILLGLRIIKDAVYL